MLDKKIIFFLFVFVAQVSMAQVCTNPGQTPSTAFPVCSNSIYQPRVTPCRNYNLYVTGCTNQNTEYGDNNPIYYRFTCYSAGTLGFTIVPDSMRDDNNWQLYDITGRDPLDIRFDRSLIVTGNWSGNLGLTGAAANGVPFIQCNSNPLFVSTPSFSAMPVLQAQHEYILLVGHNDELQGGFTINFSGGTAVINNQVAPQLQMANPSCNTQQLIVRLSKKIKCSSIALDGSDFSLSPALSTIQSAAGIQCNPQIETDSILLTFSAPLAPGNYSLISKNGNDGNTLVDYCGNTIGIGINLPFKVTPFALLDSIASLPCTPDRMTFFFKTQIHCQSIAADGSDFIITGPSPVTIIAANTICTNNNNSNLIELQFSQPITQIGNYTIALKLGNDGNTIINDCGTPSPVGTAMNFVVKDQVNADFSFTIREGCISDTVVFTHDGLNQVNQWLWKFDSTTSSAIQNPTQLFPSSGNTRVQLIVSNGMCSDTSSKSFVLKEKLSATIVGPVQLCPEDPALFTVNSTATTNWFWNFANGQTSNLQNPPSQSYPASNADKIYTVSLIAGNANCSTTVNFPVKVLTTCYVAVPTAFTPNGDQLNDFLYPMNAFQASALSFKVFNRMGQLVFSSNSPQAQWNGEFAGKPQPAGSYAWTLQYTLRNNGQKVTMKGITQLIR